MSRPTSAVAICNLALDLLKERPISSIEDPESIPEAICARWYDVDRAALLQAYNWGFATKSRAIPLGTIPDVAIYSDAYVFPNDYLHLKAIISPRQALNHYDYSIEGNLLLKNNGGASSLDIWYIFDEVTVTKFSPLFTELFAAELALRLSFKITVKPEIVKLVKTLADTLRLRALAKNGQADPPRRYEQSKIVNAGLFPASAQQVAGNYSFDDYEIA